MHVHTHTHSPSLHTLHTLSRVHPQVEGVCVCPRQTWARWRDCSLQALLQTWPAWPSLSPQICPQPSWGAALFLRGLLLLINPLLGFWRTLRHSFLNDSKTQGLSVKGLERLKVTQKCTYYSVTMAVLPCKWISRQLEANIWKWYCFQLGWLRGDYVK